MIADGEHDHYGAINAGRADLEVEQVEVDTVRRGEHDTYIQRIYICGGEEGCGEELDWSTYLESRE